MLLLAFFSPLLELVHASVGAVQQFLAGRAVLRIEGGPQAHRHQGFTGDFGAGLSGNFDQLHRTILDIFASKSRQYKDKFVPSHSGDIVVLAAGSFETFRDRLKQLITDEVAESVVDLLKSIEIPEKYGERSTGPTAPGNFGLEVTRQATGVGKLGEVIGPRGRLGAFIFEQRCAA